MRSTATPTTTTDVTTTAENVPPFHRKLENLEKIRVQYTNFLSKFESKWKNWSNRTVFHIEKRIDRIRGEFYETSEKCNHVKLAPIMLEDERNLESSCDKIAQLTTRINQWATNNLDCKNRARPITSKVIAQMERFQSRIEHKLRC